jgi:hypothetical protein
MDAVYHPAPAGVLSPMGAGNQESAGPLKIPVLLSKVKLDGLVK